MIRGKLKTLCESHVADAGGEVKEGVKRFANEVVEFMADEKFSPSNMSIKEIFEQTTMREYPDLDPVTTDTQVLSEAIGHSWFPFITKELINKALLPAYEYSMNGVDDLVSEMETSRVDFDYIAGVEAMTRLPRVRPGQPYPNAEFAEKTVRVELAKFGEILNLEKELILGDQTGKLLDRARNAGNAMGDHRHRFIVETILDGARNALDESSSTAFHYKGSAHGIYSDDHSATLGYANDNLAASSSLGTAGLDTAYGLLGKMQDEKGRYITVIAKQLLVHPSNFRTAWQLTSDTTQPDTANRGSNFYKNALGIMAYQSPYVGTASGGATTDWYLGDFPRNFVWMWVWRPSTDREGVGSTASFERDVVARFKYHYSGGCAARDTRFVIEGNA